MNRYLLVVYGINEEYIKEDKFVISKDNTFDILDILLNIIQNNDLTLYSIRLGNVDNIKSNQSKEEIINILLDNINNLKSLQNNSKLQL